MSKRLMLGGPAVWLLVVVADNYDPENFKFSVVNGLWTGEVISGKLHADRFPEDKHEVKILTDNQDRLRGYYETVFRNFHNPDYVAPVPCPAKVDFSDMDDDIPF